MRNEEKLYLAIGEVDDSLIAEASALYKKGLPVNKIIATAASVAIVTAAVVGASGLFGNLLTGNMKGDSMAPQAPESNDNENPGSEMDGNDSADPSQVLTSEYGRLIPISQTENSFSFLLVLSEDANDPIHITLYSTDKKTAYSTSESTLAETVYKPAITVDGVKTDTIPMAKGDYYLTVSFEGMSELSVEWENYFEIEDFGRVYLLNHS